MRKLSHSGVTPRAATLSNARLLRRAVTRLKRARLHFGHGTQTPMDDAAALLAHARGLRRPLEQRDMPQPVPARALQRFERLLQRRIRERVPVVYLTHRCWYAGLPLYVDERVLIPRSPIAELVVQQFAPWVQ